MNYHNLKLAPHLLIFIILIDRANGSLDVPSNNTCIALIKKYLKPPESLDDHPDLITVAMIGTTKPFTRDSAEWFISINHVPKAIINSQQVATFNIPKMIFLFTENVEDVYNTLEWVSNESFWVSGQMVIIIICKTYSNIDFLNNLMRYIWYKKILKFLVLLKFKDEYLALTYNPFRDVIEKLTVSRGICQIMNDDFRNIGGYQLNVTLFERPPHAVINRIFQFKKGQWFGGDYEFIKLLTYDLNATLNLKEKPLKFDDTIYKNLVDSSDFCGVRQFLSEDLFNSSSQDFDITYPLEMDSLYVLVPEAGKIPQYQNLTTAFGPRVWISIFVLFFAVGALLKWFFKRARRYRKISLVNGLLLSLSGIVGRTIARFHRFDSYIKLFMLGWIWTCLILTTAFECSLISNLVTPRYRKNIDSLQELRQSNISIYIAKQFANQLPKDLDIVNQLIVVNREELMKIIAHPDSIDLNKGYIVNSLVASYYKSSVQKNKHELAVLDIPLVSGYNVYIFAKHSPYLLQANKFILHLHQYGLTLRENFIPKEKLMGSSHPPPGRLSMYHLQGAFYFLIIAQFYTLCVFLLEICCNNKKRNCIRYNS